MVKLLPCPFCGGEAEADGSRGYRMIVSGRVGRAVAIYCLSCDADMSRCCEDTPETDPEVLMADLVDAWNRRPATTVKPLEWDREPRRGQRARAIGLGLKYEIAFYAGDFGPAIYRWAGDNSPWSEPFKDFASAKAAAQADYERRVLSEIQIASPAGERIRSAQDEAMEPVPATGQPPVGAGSRLSFIDTEDRSGEAA